MGTTDLKLLNPEDRYRLLLSVSQAANESLELTDVVEAVIGALDGFVDIDAIGVVRVSEGFATPIVVCVKGAPRQETDSTGELIASALVSSEAKLRSRVVYPPLLFAGSGTEHVAVTRRPYVCEDLPREQRFAEDTLLVEYGVRSLVRVPLFVHDRLIGSLVFARAVAGAFSELEVDLLMAVSGPVAAAVANALAFVEIAHLKTQLEKENMVLRDELDVSSFHGDIVGNSRPLRRLLAQISKVSDTDTTVLISGETGTGKELVARALHRHSRRAEHAMVAVNCAAMPANLIASELFGHEKGAFTGAMARRLGRFELANGGTLFLDECADLPPEVQVALLRVLQEGELERVGGNETLSVDVRLIAATNRDLMAEVKAGRFRSDLYYRLAVFPIQVPTLRERPEDIPLLVEYFASRIGPRLAKRFRSVERESMERLQAYAWPGNVRELQNIVERAAILCDSDTLRIDQPLLSGAANVRESGAVAMRYTPLADSLEREERQQIEESLSACGGRVSGSHGAAALLGIPASTLESKILRLGIDKWKFRSPDSNRRKR